MICILPYHSCEIHLSETETSFFWPEITKHFFCITNCNRINVSGIVLAFIYFFQWQSLKFLLEAMILKQGEKKKEKGKANDVEDIYVGGKNMIEASCMEHAKPPRNDRRQGKAKHDLHTARGSQFSDFVSRFGLSDSNVIIPSAATSRCKRHHRIRPHACVSTLSFSPNSSLFLGPGLCTQIYWHKTLILLLHEMRLIMTNYMCNILVTITVSAII